MNNKGFTFIELLITLAVFAIAFLPLVNMFTVSLEQTHVNGDLVTARYLAQEGMERLKNLNYTEAQISRLGDVWEPAKDEPALEINGVQWRVLRNLVENSDPLEVHIEVFKEEDVQRADEHTKPLIELVTLYEDFDWAFTP